MQRIGLAGRIRAGARVAITAGSRGIKDMTEVLRACVAEVKAVGAVPVVVPAMGSHGGATAEGQADMLRGLGVTEATVGAPIVSSMEVVDLGRTADGVPVLFSRDAMACDHVIVVNRIKPHTEFNGRIESGLVKMMVIGLGKHRGAIEAHRWAVRYGYERTLVSVARVMLEKAPIALGIGIVENGLGRAACIRAVAPDRLVEDEMELLEHAKRTCPHLPFDRLDILVVDESGKEVSGSGMDTKVVGRIMNVYEAPLEHPHITRIVLRDLTETSHGNGLGIGLADFITRRVVDKLDRAATRVNCITAVTPEKGRLPIVGDTDRAAIDYAFASAGPVTAEDVRLCWIRNTATMDTMVVSTALLDEVAARPGLAVTSDPFDMAFGPEGDLLRPA
nr:lactate racemase domain-containing protein [Rhodoplanes tepidamans]